MTDEETKKQLMIAYAWGQQSAAAPACFDLDEGKLLALCAGGVMPPKGKEGAGSTPATGGAGKDGSVGELHAAACVETTSSTNAGQGNHSPAPWLRAANGATTTITDANGDFVAVLPSYDNFHSGVSDASVRAANASVIVAALDLLEIAKTTLGNVMSLHGRTVVTEVWIDELERAIAKAEGRS